MTPMPIAFSDSPLNLSWPTPLHAIPWGNRLDHPITSPEKVPDPVITRCNPVIVEGLNLIAKHLPCRHRIFHPGDSVYLAAQPFSNLHIVHSGLLKLVNRAPDGHQQVVALRFKGDWLGFDGIAEQRHTCEAVALDISEVWTISYASLVAVGQDHPVIIAALHAAISQDMASMRKRLVAHHTLTMHARVAQFLLYWSNSLAQRGLHSDRFKLRLSREEIGSYLGLTLESISRSISHLVREGLICFDDKGRRDLKIPDSAALDVFVTKSLTPLSEGSPRLTPALDGVTSI
jgi:CRP/FNR family transcriptional regulator